MKLTGDSEGIAELKFIKENKLFYLKFLLNEAKTNTNRSAEFKGRDGKTKYRMTFNDLSGELKIDKIPD
ncbi:MAG: hypothetical protein JSU92_07050 [Deltaproteobacteria bacterium]|nr:MAG: hypothetical protein JSU92_07050 [Deltaproteobacteria bacterium]